MDWTSCTIGTDKVATLDCFPYIFQRFVIAAWMLAGITAAILIAYAGTHLILAEGDAKKLESARHILYYAIAGLIIVFLAAFIVSTVAYIMGVPCIGDVIPGFTNCADPKV